MDLDAFAGSDMGLLRELADRNGVATQFWSWHGELTEVSAISLLKILKALGIPVDEQSTVCDIQNALTFTEDEIWRPVLPECTVARIGNPKEIWLHVPHGSHATVFYKLEGGETGTISQCDKWLEPRQVDGHLRSRFTFLIPETLPLGYHQLVAEIDGQATFKAPLIIVPQGLDTKATAHGKRLWGVLSQFYSVRSHKSWGIGDTQDLADLIVACAERGSDFVMINPANASSPVSPIEASPYLPVSRHWTNPIYIRPENIQEYASLSDGDKNRIEDLRRDASMDDNLSALIDRDRLWNKKIDALNTIFQQPMSVERQNSYDSFCDKKGAALDSFALWCALVEDEDDHPQENLGYSDTKLGGNMPAPIVFPASNPDFLDQERRQLSTRIDFYKWLQWVVQEQFVAVQETAKRSGMEIGLMSDLAIGLHPQGQMVWSLPDIFAKEITVGAPPDMYSQQGQNWMQPPALPRELIRRGYEPFRQMLHTIFSQCGAVRLDHVAGLFRLWWIPEDLGSSGGTYVYYDHEALVGIVLLEAAREQVLVVGEDLGTIEPWVRPYLEERGLFGTSVLWFECDQWGWPIQPQEYRKKVLVTVNTHDLPPASGYIDGIQTDIRSDLGLLVQDVDTVHKADEEEKERMLIRLRENGLIGEDPSSDEIVEALYRYIARTPSQLVGISLVDAVGDRQPQNIPGTNREYPNWCVPLCDGDGHAVSVEELADREDFDTLLRAVNDEMR